MLKNTLKMLKKIPKVNQCTTSITSAKASSYSQNVDEFMEATKDIIEDDHSPKQTRHTAVIFSVKLSDLPEISEETMPRWRNMKKNRKYICVICGKKKLLKERYDDHVVRTHVLDLQAPNVEEFQVARSIWLLNKAKASPKELETLTCDYDSETERRYSEDESETESNHGDSSDNDEIEVNPSENNDDIDNLNYEEEEQPNMLSRERYDLERRESSRSMENQFNEIEDTIEHLWTISDTRKSSSDSRNRELGNLNEGIKDLMSSFEQEKAERATLLSQIETVMASDESSNEDDELINSSKNA